jgi:hypothetical protein
MKTTIIVRDFNNRRALRWLCPLFKTSVPKSRRDNNYDMLLMSLPEKDSSVLVEDILFHSRIHKEHSFELAQIFESENNEVLHVYEVQDGGMTFKYLDANDVIDMPDSVISDLNLCRLALVGVQSLSRIDVQTHDQIFFSPWEATITLEEDGYKLTVIKNRNKFKVLEPKSINPNLRELFSSPLILN